MTAEERKPAEKVNEDGEEVSSVSRLKSKIKRVAADG